MVMSTLYLFMVLMFSRNVMGLNLPNCSNVEFFEASSLTCRPCPNNGIMISSVDGLSCKCENHSIPTESGRCKACNVTELVSADGTSCVPRRCQASAGKVVCRKCPNDYISVTQNHDGSSLKEVQCVKCAHGFKALNNVCVKCETCVCKKSEVVVRGKCLSKKYVVDRPKYEEKLLHPIDLLDVVKYEYMCINYDIAACRWLANACVTNFYSSDPAGPCRIWIYPNLVARNILPTIFVNKSQHKEPDEINLTNRQVTLLVSAIKYNTNGKYEHLQNPNKKMFQCFPPFTITIGEDYSQDCTVNTSELSKLRNELFALYIASSGNMKPLSLSIQKPDGHLVQMGLWPSNKFAKYFMFHQSLSPRSNITNMLYLRNLRLHLRIERKPQRFGSLKLHINFETQYAVKSPFSETVTTSIEVKHVLPSAGVIGGIEIWGSILSILMAFYAIAQWRGVVRRGGLQISLLPLMTGCIADGLYFATWSSVTHGLAAEAGTLGLTLPLSQEEERVIESLIYTVVILKIVKVAYVNWNQCRCDIFFIDWSEYNPNLKDVSLLDQSNNWKPAILAREWAAMQTKRRTSPGATVALTLFSLHLIAPWNFIIPKSRGYQWAVATMVWWSSYSVIALAQIITNRFNGSPSEILPRICSSLEFSLLVFQEDLYAHYVHGRNDNTSEARYLAGPLTTCRVVCAPQLSAICKQLLTAEQRTLEKNSSKQMLLSRFLSAFFERALDGLSWVASERTVLEKLLDIEISVREGGNTSILLYDAKNSTPSYFGVTWWSDEWTLATLDSMMFSSMIYATDAPLLAGLLTLLVYQIMKYTRLWLGKRNLRNKTDVEFF